VLFALMDFISDKREQVDIEITKEMEDMFVARKKSKK
jgi:hypothetical protein